MAAAGLALAVAGFRPATTRPSVISGADLPSVLFAGAAFFTVNFLLAGTAGALHSQGTAAAQPPRRSCPSRRW